MLKSYIRIILLGLLLILISGQVAFAETVEEQLNNLVGPKQQYNTMLSPVYLRTNATESSISNQNGGLSLSQADYVLSGRSGLNLEIKRIYKSGNSNVQEMNVKYVNGAWVDYVESDSKTSSFYEDRYNLGIGMRFSFPQMEIKNNSDGTSHKFLHTESGDVYRLVYLKEAGEYAYYPEGQTVKDVAVRENGGYSNGQTDGTSKYMMTGKDGKKTYFAEDGRLLGIQDRYGNTIKFEYTVNSYEIDGQKIERKLMNKITDTVGRVVTIEYKEDHAFTVSPISSTAYSVEESWKASQNPNNTDSGDLQGKFQVIIHLPNEKTIVYDKSAVLVSTTKHVIRTRLQRVFDVDQKPKYHYWYEQPDQGFTYMNGAQYSAYNRYENLVQIDNVKTNKLKRYVYNNATKRLYKGSMQYRKIFEDKDLIRVGYDPAKTDFLDKFVTEVKNKTNYDYTNEPDGYGFEGYLDYDNAYLRNTYRYYSEVTDVLGNKTKFTYDGLNQQLLTESTGADHRITMQNEHDEMRLVKKKVTLSYPVANSQPSGDPVKKTENYRYDEYGNLTNYTGPEAKRDENGNPVNNEHMVTYAYAYDKFHMLTLKTWKQDALTTNQISYEIDSMGNIKRQSRLDAKNPNQSVLTDYEYDSYGNVIKQTESSGDQAFATYYEYNAIVNGAHVPGIYLTNKYQISEGTETATQYGYDWATGNRTEEIDPNGNRTSYTFDVFNRLTGVVSADGSSKVYSYQETPLANMTIHYRDQNANEFLYEYDITGTLVCTSVFSNHSWVVLSSAQYDGLGNKLKETDANGNSTHYEYDSLNRLISKSAFEKDTALKGTTTVKFVTAFDLTTPLLVTITNEEGYQKRMYYDNLGRLLKEESTPDKVQFYATAYTYDYVGNKVSQTDPRGYTTTYSYDSLGRLIQIRDALGYETNKEYNARNQVSKQKSPEGSTTEFLFNSLGLIALRKVYRQGSGDYTYTAFGYDKAGNEILAKQGSLCSGTDELSSETSRTYDVMHRVTDEYQLLTGEKRAHITYAYDRNGNRTRLMQYANEAESHYRAYTYSYDYNNRVTEESGAFITRDAGQNEELEFGRYAKRYQRDYGGNVISQSVLGMNGWETTEMVYNYRNLPVEKKEPYGKGVKRTTFQYDKTGRMINETKVVGEEEQTISYVYDGLGRLRMKTDPLGNTARFLYDGNGNRTKEINPRYLGQPEDSAPGTETEYDALNRPVKVVSFDGSNREVLAFRLFDGQGNIIKEVAGEGFNAEAPEQSIGILSEYDANNRKISVTTAQLAVMNKQEGTSRVSQSYEYNGSGNLLSVKDVYGNQTRYQYDLGGRVTEIAYPDGSKEQFEYDLTGKSWTLKRDKLGRETVTFFTVFDKPYLIQYPDGGTLRYVYSPKGEVVESYDQLGNQKQAEYDASGNQVSNMEYLGTEGSTKNYRRVEMVFDEANCLVSKETFLIRKSTEENLPEQKMAIGNKIVYEYDQVGQLIKQSGPTGREIIYQYDEAGNQIAKLIKVDESKYNVTRNEYDSRSRLIKQSLLVKASDLDSDSLAGVLFDNEFADHVLSSTSYTYTPSGKTKTVTDPRGYVSLLEYDYDLQVVKKTDPAKAVTEYRYDDKGRLVEQKNAKGILTLYQYDSMDRLIREVVPAADGGQAITRHIYDAAGNVVKKISPNFYDESQDTPASVMDMPGLEYVYDSMNRRIVTKSPYGQAVEYISYDKRGQVQKIVDGLRFAGTIDSSPGTTYQYDGTGNVLVQTDALRNQKTYAYDVLGNLTAKTDARGYKTTYEYAADSTLVRMILPDGGEVSYLYDKLGRKISETNAIGAITTYAYNAFGKERTVKDADGFTVEARYDLTGNTVSLKDKLGSTTLFKYDANQRQVEKKTPLDRDDSNGILYSITTIQYDILGNVVKRSLTGSKDKEFLRETSYVYTPNNMLSSQTDNGGATVRFFYDKNGNLVKKETLRDSANYDVEKYEYDLQNRMVKNIKLVNEADIADTSNWANIANLRDKEYPGKIGVITGYEYDLLGNRVKEVASRAYAFTESDSVNRELHTVTFSYDALNRLLALTRKHEGADVQIIYGYDEEGNRSWTRNERGDTTQFSYDGVNRLISMTDAEGGTFSYTYDLAGNKLTETNALGNKMTYAYDKLGRLIEVTDPDGTAVIRYAYDANGNVRKKMDADGIQSGDSDQSRLGWEFDYDMANRRVKEKDPQLAMRGSSSPYSITYRYNPAGDVIEKIDALGNSSIYTYNRSGLLTSVTEASKATTSYEYDKAGSKLYMTDGRGKTTTYRYGSFGMLLEVVNAAGRTETYKYDLAMQIAVFVDGNGNHTGFKYDSMNRLLVKSVAETGDKIAFTYDAYGNRSSMTDQSGVSLYTYDSNNRLLLVKKDGDTELSYTYDASGNVIAVTDKLGNMTTYTYDKSSRMKTVEADGKTSVYEYDRNGNRKSVVYPGGVSEEYTYDKAYRLLQVVNRKPDRSMISEYAYTYDDAGQQISKTDSYGTTDYTYDEAGRIYRIDAPGKTTFYSYDAAGNRQSLQETYTSAQPGGYKDPNTGKEVEYWIKKSDYLYSKDNRLMKLTEHLLDSASQDVLEKTTEYLYDGNGNELRQKISYVQPHNKSLRQTTGGSLSGDTIDSELNAVIEKVSNTFDGFNQLIMSERIKNGERITIGFVYNGDGLRTQKILKSSKNDYTPQVTNYLYDRQYVILETDGSGELNTRYVRGINYISRTAATDNAAEQTSYFLFNGHGDVVQTVSEAGEIENQYDYDVFGNPTLTVELYASSIRYAGEFYDVESGLYYLRARYYNPYTGRFISEDSYWGEDNNPLSLNRYTYAHNNPIMNVDPSGHFILNLLTQLLANAVNNYVQNHKDEIVDTVKNSMIKQVDEQKQIWADEESGAGQYQSEPTAKQNEAHQRAEELKKALAYLDRDIPQAQQMLGRANENDEDWEGYKTLSRVSQVQLQYDPVTMNNDTLRMQKRLNELGYTGEQGQPLSESGIFDNDTLNAVNKFKAKNQLTNDGQYAGKVGETTWLTLFSNSAFHAKGIGMTLSYQSSGDYVSTMQSRLNELGYVGQNGMPLSNNGIFDDDTLYAINQFKSTNDLWNQGQYSGKVGDTTWIQMFSEKAQKNVTGYNFEAELLLFPESYRDKLRDLHEQHPEWRIYAEFVNLDFNSFVDAQVAQGQVCTPESKYGYNPAWRDPSFRSWDAGYNSASREAVAYFMDPRNHVNDKKIFQFFSAKYDESTQNLKAVQDVLGSSSMNPQAFLDGGGTNTSAVFLAAKAMIESGGGRSTLAIGTVKGYEGWHNVYGINATDGNAAVNGAKMAQSKDWNSQDAAIIGGGQWIYENYVQSGQDTLYSMKWNYQGYLNNNKVTHQYATHIKDAYNKADKFSNGLGGIEAPFVFRIPVYNNMPDAISAEPVSASKR